MATRNRWACPHCGNANPATIQDNAYDHKPGWRQDPDLTLLCVARVKPDEWSFDIPPEPDQIGPDGLVECGMQWDPNEWEADAEEAMTDYLDSIDQDGR